jgi:hypothetical protein
MSLQFNLPKPNSALDRAIERLLFIALAAAGSDWLGHVNAGNGAKVGGIYFAIKTLVDLLNRNVPNY